MPFGRLALIEDDIIELLMSPIFDQSIIILAESAYWETRLHGDPTRRGLQPNREEGLQSPGQCCPVPRFLSNIRAWHRPCLLHRLKETANPDPMRRELHV